MTTTMERKVRDGYVLGRIRAFYNNGGFLRHLSVVVRVADDHYWPLGSAPDECFEPEETLTEKAEQIVAEVRKRLDCGAPVGVEVSDSPVTPHGGTPSDTLWAGKCGVVRERGMGDYALRVHFVPGDDHLLIWANNLKILDHIPPEFAEEDLRGKAERRAVEIRAKLDACETVFVQMVDSPVTFGGISYTNPRAGQVGRATSTGHTNAWVVFSDHGEWRDAHNLTILTPEEMVTLANRATS